jgi:hypothetical protein
VSHRIKLSTREYGELRLELVSTNDDGTWEPEWEPLRGTLFGSLFSTLSKEELNHALRGWTQPMARALGIPPEGALKKVPRQCARRSVCPLHIPNLCFPESKNMPWCFEPDGVGPEIIRNQATRAIELWRDRVYLVVIKG